MTIPNHPPLFGGVRAHVRHWFYLHVCRWKTELCQICGGRNRPQSWHAPDDLFMEVTDGEIGLICPECFDKMAWDKGLYVTWAPHVTFQRNDAGEWIEDHAEQERIYG